MSTNSLKTAIQIATRAVQLDSAREFVDALAHYDQCLDMLRRARTDAAPNTLPLIDAKVAEYSKRAAEIRATLQAAAPDVPDAVPDLSDSDDEKEAAVPPKPVATPTPPTPTPTPTLKSKISIVSESVVGGDLVIKMSDDPSTLQALLALGHRAAEADRLGQFERAFPLYRHLATALVRLAKLENNVRAREAMLQHVKQYTERAEQLRTRPGSQTLRNVIVDKFEPPPKVAPAPPAPAAPAPPVAAPLMTEIDRVWADILLVPFVAKAQ